MRNCLVPLEQNLGPDLGPKLKLFGAYNRLNCDGKHTPFVCFFSRCLEEKLGTILCEHHQHQVIILSLEWSSEINMGFLQRFPMLCLQLQRWRRPSVRVLLFYGAGSFLQKYHWPFPNPCYNANKEALQQQWEQNDDVLVCVTIPPSNERKTWKVVSFKVLPDANLHQALAECSVSNNAESLKKNLE